MNKTSLYKKHVDLEAKILEYAGYMMPINYKKGIQYEYNSVRNNVGIFDVSHMGEIFIEGVEAYKLLSRITINDLNKISENQAQYTAICNNDGGIIDDIILYKLSLNKFLLIVNGSNLKNVFNWIEKKNNFDCTVNNRTNDFSLLALQGPNSRMVLEKILMQKVNLEFYHHAKYIYNDNEIFISRTGYTGELGYELMGNHNIITTIWDKFINHDVVPCGLAVRDVLRLEMKYCLYGSDINEKISPIEAGLKWIVNNSNKYIGKNVIDNQILDGVDKKLICIEMIDKAIPRTGYKIFSDQKEIGKISSGTFSISLKKGIAMAYIKSEYIKKNKIVKVKIRDKYFKGQLVNPPFIKNFSLHK